MQIISNFQWKIFYVHLNSLSFQTFRKDSQNMVLVARRYVPSSETIKVSSNTVVFLVVLEKNKYQFLKYMPHKTRGGEQIRVYTMIWESLESSFDHFSKHTLVYSKLNKSEFLF